MDEPGENMNSGRQTSTTADEAQEFTAILIGEFLEDFPEVLDTRIIPAYFIQHDCNMNIRVGVARVHSQQLPNVPIVLKLASNYSEHNCLVFKNGAPSKEVERVENGTSNLCRR